MKKLNHFLIILALLGVAFVTNTSNVFADSNLADGFDYPVGKPDGIGYADAQDFGVPNPNFGGKYHLGEDWNRGNCGDCDLGDSIYSIGNGIVLTKAYKKVWGNVIIIQHELPNGSKINSLYGHFQNMVVNEGDIVKRGQLIGTMGKGDKGMFPAHLHFEIRTNTNIGVDYGYSSTPKPAGWVDPSDFINSNRPLPKAVLAATETTDTTAKLSWTKPAINNFQKYALYRSEVAGGAGAESSRTLVSEFTNPDTLEHTDTNLTPEKDYFYKLFAFDNTGNFSESEEVSVKTKEKVDQVENITQNQWNQIFPSIYGNRIVWEDGRQNSSGTYDPSLYYYDIEKKEVLSKDISNSRARGVLNPVIYKNIVAFEGINQSKLGYGSNVYMYNFDTDRATLLTDTEQVGFQGLPDIYENYIVWQDERKGAAESDIHIIDISSGWQGEYPLVDTPGRQATPKIWGTKVVYVDSVVVQASTRYNITMIDIITKQKTVITQSVAYVRPTIDGDKVSWLLNKKIYVYDIQTGATTIHDFGNVATSTIKENKLTYQLDPDAMDVTELHLYDLIAKKDTLVAKMDKWYRSADLFENYLTYYDTGPAERSSSWADIFLVRL